MPDGDLISREKVHHDMRWSKSVARSPIRSERLEEERNFGGNLPNCGACRRNRTGKNVAVKLKADLFTPLGETPHPSYIEGTQCRKSEKLQCRSKVQYYGLVLMF